MAMTGYNCALWDYMTENKDKIYREPPTRAWHAYRLHERHAPWKLFLPMAGEAPVLAVGLEGSSLASLARSRQTVDLYDCQAEALRWAQDHGENLRQAYRFKGVNPFRTAGSSYGALAMGAGSAMETGEVFRLLAPGGAAAWIGSAGQVPSASRLAAQGFQSVRRYAILPPQAGKILVPLATAGSTHAGLNMYTPSKWHNRLAVRVAHWASDLGLRRLLGRRQAVVARKPGRMAGGAFLLDWLAERLGLPLADATVYAGWTKMVLQLLGPAGEVLGFAKLADIDLGKHGIKQETAILRRLADRPDFSGRVPKILFEGRWGGHLVQVQTEVSSGPPRYQTWLTPAHRELLAALSRLDRSEGRLQDWPQWEQIWNWAHGADFAPAGGRGELLRLVEGCAERLGHRKILFHRIHGDFSPWHALSTARGLTVIDWEDSEARGLPFMDAIRFVLARDFHLYGRIPDFGEILHRSPLTLGNGRELRELAGSLEVSPEIAHLALLSELFRLRNFWQR